MIGGVSSIPSGGGKPEGKEGVQYSHVRGHEFYLVGVLLLSLSRVKFGARGIIPPQRKKVVF